MNVLRGRISSNEGVRPARAGVSRFRHWSEPTLSRRWDEPIYQQDDVWPGLGRAEPDHDELRLLFNELGLVKMRMRHDAGACQPSCLCKRTWFK